MVDEQRIAEFCRRPNVDVGEAAAVALAVEQAVRYVLIDDAAGRVLAEAEGLLPVGCIGLALLAEKAGLHPSARDLVADLRSAGLWCSDRMVREILRRRR
ncbi:hypothetical protein L6R50_14780 [Myxococcota bacterium]|nr:hypothetical protein [Myxococcota bacterium]